MTVFRAGFGPDLLRAEEVRADLQLATDLFAELFDLVRRRDDLDGCTIYVALVSEGKKTNAS